MRLKKLKLSGFKSFADDVSLAFDGQIVAIVGPNGCGKSNIVDAFKWVLGEQSVKSLRGEKMGDVIFSGSERRKPLNFAEVTLVLDDVEESLKVPYNQVAITRRIYRNGESEYSLNKENVRLKDILHLLSGSGIGKDAFFLFEQGKLDEMIYLNPQDRRHIFDEAAGISRFLNQKKETTKRLLQVNENYAKASLIHEEADKRRALLKKQAEQAEAYQKCQEELLELEKSLLVFKVNETKGKLEKNSLKKKELEESFESQKLKLEHFEKELSTFAKEMEDEGAKVEALKEASYQSQSILEFRKAELKREKDHFEENQKKEKKLQEELKKLGERASPKEDDIDEKRARLLFLEKEKSVSQAAFEKEKMVFKEFEEEFLKFKEEERKLGGQMRAIQDLENRFSLEHREKKLFINHLLEKLAALGKKESDLRTKTASNLSEKELKEKESLTLSSKLDEIKVAIAGLEGEGELLKREESDLKGHEEKNSAILFEKMARLKALLSLKESMEGFEEASKILLKESKNPSSVLFGKLVPLVDFFKFKKKKSSLSHALDSYSTTLVVKKTEDLEVVLHFTLQNKLKGFSLISEDSVEEGTPFFEEEVHSNPISSHFLRGLSLKENELLEDARGVLWSFGDNKKLFSREEEMLALEREIPTLQEKKEELKECLLKLNLKKASFEERKRELFESRKKYEIEHHKSQFYLQEVFNGLNQARVEEDKINNEREALEALLEKNETDIHELNDRLEEVGKKRGVLSEEMATREATNKALLEKEGALKKEKEKKEALFFGQVKEWEELFSLVKSYDANVISLKAEKVAIEKRLMEVSTLQNESLKKSQNLEKELEELASKQNDVIGKRKEREELFFKGKQEKEKKEKAFLHEKSLLGAIRLKIEQLVEIQERESIEAQEAGNDLLIKFPGHDGKVSFTTTFDEAKKRAIELKYEIQKMQDLNLASIVELKEEEARFSNLDRELEDLKATKEELENIIKKIEEECRKAFKITFERIRKSFQKNYTILFKGGRADLKLTESDDLLSTGVEIFAEPPGKQMRALSLLSGGEKCLTAIALLFSIFETKPAPFCILDEIDAPLDDANVGRFTDMLRQYTGSTQFILVTHNKKTMGIADTLFGVSMEEKGVSKMLALELERKTVLV